MIGIIIVYALCHLLIGSVLQQMSYRRQYRWQAYLVCLVGWPWLLYIEGTPRMIRYLEWAEKND